MTTKHFPRHVAQNEQLIKVGSLCPGRAVLLRRDLLFLKGNTWCKIKLDCTKPPLPGKVSYSFYDF